MLFLYNPVSSLVRKHSAISGSFFDDDYSCPSLVRVNGRKDHKNHTGGAFQLSLDVPGVKPADIQVTLDRNVLNIQGETKNRRFQQTMTVNTDETDLSQLTAELSDGVLTLKAPARAKPDPVQVTVTTNNNDDEDNEITEDDDDKKMMRRSIEIPGVKLSDLNVTFEEGTTLHVRGTRWEKALIHKTMRIDADQVNTSELTANLSHGILTVQAPKIPRPQPQTVTIETAAVDVTADDRTLTTTNNTTMTSDATILASVDLPGVRRQDVTVSTVRVDQRRTAVDIRASRNCGNNDQDNNNQNKKLRISKLILLDHDTYNMDKLKAQLLDGVLTITAPKTPNAESRVVPIVVTTTNAAVPTKKAIADDERKATEGESTTESGNQEKNQ